MPILDTIDVEPIDFRSVAERKLGDAILKKEGSWDTSTQSFLTKERQLQERTRVFTQLHATLRVVPELQYATEGRDMDAEYPQCPRTLLHELRAPSARLDHVDPHPKNVEKQYHAAHETRSCPSPLQAMAGRVGSDEINADLEQVLLQAAQDSAQDSRLLSATPRAAASDDRPGTAGRPLSPWSLPRDPSASVARRSSAFARLPKPSTPLPAPAAATAASPVPEVSVARDRRGGTESLLMELHRTKREMRRSGAESSQRSGTLQAILTMDCSADLKRAITRMFADPKNADNISNEEHARRERQFQDDRKAQLKHQQQLLAEERAVLERERVQLRDHGAMSL